MRERLHALGDGVARHRSALAVLAGVIGLAVGAAAVAFHWMIGAWMRLMSGTADPTAAPTEPHQFLGLGPLFVVAVPVLSGLLYGPVVQRIAPSARGHGIPEVMLALAKKDGRIPGRVAVVKLFASALTIGGGGSAGREGPIVQVGASLGSWMAGLLRMPPRHVILLASCGGAAGIAATFNAPLAGAIFALEVLLARFSAERFGYVVISAVMASLVSRAVLGSAPLVDLHMDVQLASLHDMGWIALLGLLAGLVGIGFSKTLYKVEDLLDWIWKRTHIPEAFRPAVLGLFLGLGLLAFPYMYGSGYPVQANALLGHYSVGFLLLLLVMRVLFTSWTIGMGGSGGVFAPTLFMGAMAGMAFGQLIDPVTDTNVAVFGVIGMGAAFAGAARAPLTAVLIIVEMTSQYDLILPMMLAVVIATAASRFLTRATIYTEKLRRRGDSLQDPLAGTLLGSQRASDVMQAPPAPLPASMPAADALAELHRRGEDCAPVTSDDGTFLGFIDEGALTSPHSQTVGAIARPTPVLAENAPALEITRAVSELPTAIGVPVVATDGSGKLVGWISATDIAHRAAEEQQARIDAIRAESSWGSRWLAKHRQGFDD